jgi:hypothetical protein
MICVANDEGLLGHDALHILVRGRFEARAKDPGNL